MKSLLQRKWKKRIQCPVRKGNVIVVKEDGVMWMEMETECSEVKNLMML